MKYRKLAADRIFDGYTLQKDKVLVLDEAGSIVDLLNAFGEEDTIEHHQGILTPGFINCHCHLELSHLKNYVEPGKGLVDFLLSVIRLRKEKDEGKEVAIAAAEKELYANGIVGTADIANTTDTIPVKQGSAMRWYTFIEVLNLWDNNLESAIVKFKGVQQEYLQKGLQAVLTAHAPYSVSPTTFKAINEATAGAIISVHNQETPPENELFEKGTGRFLDFYKTLMNANNPLAVSGRSSLQTWLPFFTNGQTILLVHNTCIQEEDIVFAKEHAAKYGLQLVYCLCPNANQYIEQKLPPIELLMKHGCDIVLGTDSYSSNWQLSIAKEIETLGKGASSVSIETFLKWSTGEAAKAMQWNDLGSFEKGKKPGVVLLKEDFSVQRLA